MRLCPHFACFGSSLKQLAVRRSHFFTSPRWGEVAEPAVARSAKAWRSGRGGLAAFLNHRRPLTRPPSLRSEGRPLPARGERRSEIAARAVNKAPRPVFFVPAPGAPVFQFRPPPPKGARDTGVKLDPRTLTPRGIKAFRKCRAASPPKPSASRAQCFEACSARPPVG